MIPFNERYKGLSIDWWTKIATSLDKAHANTADRRYMFWNITLTYLLSVCFSVTSLLFSPPKTDRDRSARSAPMRAARYTACWRLGSSRGQQT